MKRLLTGIATLVALLRCSSLVAQEEMPTVRVIEIKFIGPETVSRAIVTANIQTAVGKPLSRLVIEQDVRNLIDTGYFQDVRVLEEPATDGVKVVFQVEGKATIKSLTVTGQKLYKEDRLKKELGLKVGDIYDERKLHDGVLKIEEMYQKAGFPDVKVTYETRIDVDTGKAVVPVKIVEGPKVLLKEIKFIGNKAIKTKELLHLMKTRRHWWGSWLSGTGVLLDEQFREDLDKLRDYYRSHGYIDVEIRGTHTERVGKKWMVLVIDLFEGKQYKVGAIKIEGDKLFPETELRKQLKMVTGQTFTPDGLSKDTKALEDYYGARGYLDTNAHTIRIPNVETGRIDITYKLREGELTYIELIEIRGNTKTKDKVIRRELAVAPGDIYNTVKVDASAARLKNLGYFSKIDTTPEPTTVPNRRDLAITLEEQRTGTVTFGAGFSSIDSLLGFVEVTQGNFDLFNWPNFTGGGQKLRIRAQVGIKRQDYIISFTEPWFLDKRLSLGFDLFKRSANYLSTEFSEDRTGGDIRLEKAINQHVRVSLEYSLQQITENVSTNASLEIQSQDGTSTRSALQAMMVYDARDNVFLTTRGTRSEFGVELVGGPLGGSVNVYKLNAKTSYFFPLFHGHVLQLVGAVGMVDAYGGTRNDSEKILTISGTSTNVTHTDAVPMFDRYFLGGANTLRGFAFRQVGPKDTFGQPIGGNSSYNGTAEYTIPVIDRVRFAVFFDIGEVEQNSYSFAAGDLHSDAGGGIRLNLPIGPLRLDYGYPIQTDPTSGRSGKIQFSVGYQF